MFDAILTVLNALNKLTPVGVFGLLVLTTFVFVWKNGPFRTLKDNHLHHVQEALDKIVESSDKQVELLHTIKEDISFVKGKLD
jgi:hypothetical protein